jgi:hypothetical protein
MHILVTGASGSGTSTLANALARAWNACALESDSYFWLPTQPPYSERRAAPERNALFLQALAEQRRSVTAGSVSGWGAQVEEAFNLIVFLYVPIEVRLGRLEQREVQRFGKADPAFLEWASQYDAGPPEGRSLAKHSAWLATRKCPIIRLSGDHPVVSLVADVVRQAFSYSFHPETLPRVATTRS